MESLKDSFWNQKLHAVRATAPDQSAMSAPEPYSHAAAAAGAVEHPLSFERELISRAAEVLKSRVVVAGEVNQVMTSQQRHAISTTAQTSAPTSMAVPTLGGVGHVSSGTRMVPRLDNVELFQMYLKRRGMHDTTTPITHGSGSCVVSLPALDNALLMQRCLSSAVEQLDAATPTQIQEVANWCLELVAAPDPVHLHNTAEQRSRVSRSVGGGGARTLASSPTVGDESLCLSVHRSPNRVERVVDPSLICVQDTITLVGGTEDNAFRIGAAAALRKGPAKPPTPKAMGEDAYVIACVNVTPSPHSKPVSVPIVAVLDGGGGHQLAQYGQEHLAATFERELQLVCDRCGRLDSHTLLEAMRRADHLLFNRDDIMGNPAHAYTAVRDGHAESERQTGMPSAELVRLFQRPGPFAGMNPLEAHRVATKSHSDDERMCVIETPRRAFDLRNVADAAALQHVYELAVGTLIRIEVQLVMCAYHLGQEGDGRGVLATTFNRGDCLAVAMIHNESDCVLTALSTPVSSLAINSSTVPLAPGDRVTCGCDGHFEKVSLDDHEAFDRRPDVAAAASRGGPAGYVEALAQASAWVGGGDDVTLVCSIVL